MEKIFIFEWEVIHFLIDCIIIITSFYYIWVSRFLPKQMPLTYRGPLLWNNSFSDGSVFLNFFQLDPDVSHLLLYMLSSFNLSLSADLMAKIALLHVDLDMIW